jgi:D-proline reductase (dithiol) PrdB
VVARILEAHGLSTVAISLERKLTEHTRPPRAVYLRWPYGHPLGRPGNLEEQHRVLGDALRLLERATEPGRIVDLPYRWRRPLPPVADAG